MGERVCSDHPHQLDGCTSPKRTWLLLALSQSSERLIGGVATCTFNSNNDNNSNETY